MATSDLAVPCDPMIGVIAKDVQSSLAFKKAVKRIGPCAITYRKTVHVSDELMELWYRFKENQLCQR